MSGALFYAAAIACFAVLAIVAVGFGTFAKGGETSRKWSNKIMQLRVLAQLVAVILIVVLAWVTGG
jgi:hypothetical protein